MILEIHKPSFPLNQYIELMAFYEGYCPNYPQERVLPEGRLELFIALDDIERCFYRNLEKPRKIALQKAWVSGMQKEYFYADADQNSSMFAIKFKPGGGFPFLRIPVSELNDLFVDADEVLGADVFGLRERLLEAHSIAEMFATAEAFLMNRLRETSHCFDHTVANALAAKAGCISDTRIGNFADELGYSQKHLTHLFKKHVGLTPKYFQRLTRFHRALQHVHIASSANSVKWSDVSVKFGYYDQAHFINEFKFFAGITPNDYLHQRGDFSSFIPVFSKR